MLSKRFNTKQGERQRCEMFPGFFFLNIYIYEGAYDDVTEYRLRWFAS